MIQLGSLRRVNVRDVWPHEARDFSVWLSQRIDALGEALDLRLEFVEREYPVGRFSVDIVARDRDDERIVVIENQLGPTNHDHLGKLLTYAAGLDAAVVIWVSPEFCEEHRAAIDWLNSHIESDIQFFAVTLEALQIDNSLPAVNFKVLASPNGWQRVIAGGTRRADQRGGSPFFFEFFERLIQDLRVEGVTCRSSPSARNYQILERFFGNIQFAVAFSRSLLYVQCVIELPDAMINQAIFNAVRHDEEQLQRDFNGALTWDFMPNRRRQSIFLTSRPFDREDDDDVERLRHWATEQYVRLRGALLPRLNELVPAIEDGTAQSA